jgi:drug/metabolite transporter (DMT)-like permease
VLAALGVANNALYLGLIYVGMRSISSGLSAIIVSANPVLTALLAAVVLDEQMTWRRATGLALGIGGVVFIVESRIASGIDSSVGIMFTAAGLVSLVGGTILFKILAPKGGLWIGNGLQNLAARHVVRLGSSSASRLLLQISSASPRWRSVSIS